MRSRGSWRSPLNHGGQRSSTCYATTCILVNMVRPQSRCKTHRVPNDQMKPGEQVLECDITEHWPNVPCHRPCRPVRCERGAGGSSNLAILYFSTVKWNEEKYSAPDPLDLLQDLRIREHTEIGLAGFSLEGSHSLRGAQRKSLLRGLFMTKYESSS